MTKKFKSYVLSALAVAAIAFTGCSKNDTGMKEIEKTDFSVTLNGVNTKTTNDGMKTLWAANDAINLFHNVAGEDTPTYVSDGQFKTSAAGATATFTGTLDASFDETKTYNWYAFYPYTKQITTPANTSAGYVTVGSTAKGNQTQKGNNSTAHISGNNYPIAGVASKISGDERPVIQMRHLSSLIEVEVENATKKGEAITVSGISITADGVDIVGTYYIDFTDPYNPGFTPSGETYVSNVANLVVNSGEAIAAGEKATFYLAVKPFVVNEGDDFTITVTASNGAQEKVISADKDYEFKAGKMKKIAFAYDKTIESLDFTTVAELNELADEVGETPTSKTGKLTNAIVSFVPATNTAIITDGTGSVMYYKSGHGLKQGQTYTGNITVTLQKYKSLYSEITSIDATFTGEGAVVDPQVLTIFNMGWQYNTYQNTYAKLENVEVTAVDGKNVTVTDGEYTGFIVYCNYGTPTCVVGDKITVIGTVTQFETESTIAKELKVWKAGDFTITEHTATTHKVTFTQPTEGGTFTVKVDGSEISSGADVMEGKEVTVTASASSGWQFSSWTVNGATISSATSSPATFTMGTSDVSIEATFVSASVSSYTLDSDAIKTAHSSAWSYTSGTKTITATDGSVWTSYNTYGNTNQVTIQMRSSSENYLYTPDVGTKKITKITVDTGTAQDGSGVGTRSLKVADKDGNNEVVVDATTLRNGYTLTKNMSQIRLQSDNGAVYIKTVTILFE